jgi:hypothetical protein
MNVASVQGVKWIAAIFIATALGHATSWARNLQCVAFSEERGIPLSRGRIIRISDSHQSQALRLLGSSTFSPLNRSQAAEFISPNPLPTSRSLLSRQAEDAEDKAAQCREMASKPTWSNNDRILETASAYERYAAYTNGLKDLRPYLVNTKVLFEGTGSYSVFLKGHRLSVSHLSLGRGAKEPTNIAVVIFVEAELEAVDVSYGGAQ